MRTILVIDDDPASSAKPKICLAAPVTVFCRLATAFAPPRLFEELRGSIDLAIIDLALPGLNGFELIGALSRRPNSVKIIATSGISKESQLECATAVGAHAVIRRPPNLKIASAAAVAEYRAAIDR
jgi:CheY-like chemotaxis protein